MGGRTDCFSDYFFCDRELWPMTLAFKLDLDCVELLGSKVTVRTHRHTHMPDRLFYLDH